MEKFRRLVLLLATTVTTPAFAQLKLQEVSPPGGGGYFGQFLDVDGNTAAVSGYDYSAGTNTRVVMYDRVDDAWSRTQELPFPYQGGMPRVALCGDTLFVGRTDVAQNRGRVHVFERSAGVWTQTQILIPATSVPESHFGRAMEIDGDRAVISAPMDDAQTYRGGAVFVFEKVGGSWVETARIEPTHTSSRPFYGLSVALEGDVLVAGQPGYIGSGPNYAYVYRYDGVNWNIEERIEEIYGSGFGGALALSEDRLAVGAFDEFTQPGAVAGAVHLYRFNGSNWARTQSLWPIDGRIDSGFGATIEMDGSRLVVGSASAELGLGDTVQFYSRGANGTFTLQEVLTGEHSSYFGAGLAMDRGHVMLGAPFENSEGRVHVYSLPVGREVCVSLPNSTGSVAVLRALGSSSPADDDLALSVSPVPETSAIFAFGQITTQLPFGDGVLCLGGQVQRLGAVEARSGQLLLDVDYGAPASTLLTPGSTWNFQAVFRDPAAGGTGFNTSNSVVITFGQ